jgi:hypothetical protein
MPNVVSTYGRDKLVQIRFTGCRDRELMNYLASRGYDCKEGAVTKHTMILIVPSMGYQSKKTQSAPPGCLIIPLDTFKYNPDHYIASVTPRGGF